MTDAEKATMFPEPIKPYLAINGLSKAYGDRNAVNNVTLDIQPGEFVSIIGRSGAGKSTLLRAINRLVDCSEGSIKFGDLPVSSLKGKRLRHWRRECGMIFQHFNLVNRLDVLSNVLMGRLAFRSPLRSALKLFPMSDREDAVAALARLGVADHAFQRAGRLSGGQKQRVAIARALLQKPRVILADEPIASLDPINAKLIMEALRAVCKEEGITVLCNLHHLSVARTYSDRIVGMSNGSVVYDGPPEGLTPAIIREIYGDETFSEDEPTAPSAAPVKVSLKHIHSAVTA